MREQHRTSGHDEEEVAEGTRQTASLAKADPDQARGLERPGAGGAALVERERNDKGQEHGGDGQTRIEGDAELRALLHRRREQHVEPGHDKRRERGAERRVADQPVLQREDDRRQAEQERAVDPRVAAMGDAGAGRMSRRQQHDQHEQEEEGDQEGFAHGERLGPIAQHAPGRGDDEGRDEADQVERAPGPKPRDRGDAGIEHQVVGEQRGRVVRAGRDDQRRREAAERADHGERTRVLQHRERGGESRNRDHEGERRAGGENAVVAERGEQRQVENGDRAALQHLRIAGPRRAQPPAEAEQDDRRDADRGEAQFRWHLGVLGRVLGEKGQADEEDRDASLDDGVAADQPLTQGLERRRPRDGDDGRPDRCDRRGGQVRHRHGVRAGALRLFPRGRQDGLRVRVGRHRSASRRFGDDRLAGLGNERGLRFSPEVGGCRSRRRHGCRRSDPPLGSAKLGHPLA